MMEPPKFRQKSVTGMQVETGQFLPYNFPKRINQVAFILYRKLYCSSDLTQRTTTDTSDSTQQLATRP